MDPPWNLKPPAAAAIDPAIYSSSDVMRTQHSPGVAGDVPRTHQAHTQDQQPAIARRMATASLQQMSQSGDLSVMNSMFRCSRNRPYPCYTTRALARRRLTLLRCTSMATLNLSCLRGEFFDPSEARNWVGVSDVDLANLLPFVYVPGCSGICQKKEKTAKT